jgi:hypothetical protein
MIPKYNSTIESICWGRGKLGVSFFPILYIQSIGCTLYIRISAMRWCWVLCGRVLDLEPCGLVLEAPYFLVY